MNPLLTILDVAHICQVEQELIQRHVAAGRLKGINVGIDTEEWRFLVEDVLSFLNALRASQGTQAPEASLGVSRIPLPAVFRLNLKSAGKDPAGFCIDNGVAGVGFQVEPTDPAVPLTWPEYCRLAAVEYPDGAWSTVVALHKIARNSVIWSRRGYGNDTEFYAGLVTGDWEYLATDQAKEADMVNIVPVTWFRVGGYASVPPSIAKAFTPTTLSAIRQEEAVRFTEALASRLTSDGIWRLVEDSSSALSHEASNVDA